MSNVPMTQTIDQNQEVRESRGVPMEDGTSDSDENSQDTTHSMSGSAKRKATMSLPLSNQPYKLRRTRQKQDIENPQSGQKVGRYRRQSCGVFVVVPTISEPRLELQRRQVVELSEGQNGNNTMPDDASIDVSKMVPNESVTVNTDVPEHVASETSSPKVEQKGADADDTAMKVDNEANPKCGIETPSENQHTSGVLKDYTEAPQNQADSGDGLGPENRPAQVQL